MGLQQLNFDQKNKIEVAIERIRCYEPPDGYFLAFSGGKDSIVLYHLALESGVAFDAHYNQTGIDPPEVVRFIRDEYPGVKFEKPLLNMWRGILIHGLPLRHRRWCCQVLKEHSGDGRVLLTGIRWQESVSRRKRPIYEIGNKKLNKSKLKLGKVFVHPIADWGYMEVWEYIRDKQLKYCELYDVGFTRLGCVLCPFTSGNKLNMEIERYPKIVEAWRRAAYRYFETRSHPVRFKTGEEYFSWWLSRK